jgi:hypothetical protein
MRGPLIGSIVALLSLAALAPRTLAQTATPSTAAKSQAFDPHDLNGIWGGQSIANLTKDEPPMTPWALEKYKTAKTPFSKPPAAVEKSNDPVLTCEPAGVPRIYFLGHPMKIVQTPTKIFLLYEADRIFRIVYINGKHPEHPFDTWYGDSIGKWDGDTLVVDTIDFNERTWLDRSGHPHSDQLHLVERFTRVDAAHLHLDISIEDPMAYTKPWGGEKTFKLEPANSRIADHMCDPGNKAQILKDFFAPAAAAASPK